MSRFGRLLAVIGLSVGTLALGAVGAPSASAISQEFTSSTAWTVPAGVTCVTFDVIGARGGDGGTLVLNDALPGADGGLGGEVSVTLAATPNSALVLDVGVRGADGADEFDGGTGGAVGGGGGGGGEGSGGGGGGGASRVMLGGVPVLVAGGGGGGGASVDDTHAPGAGGVDEQNGFDGATPETDTAALGGEGATAGAGGAAGVNSTNQTGGTEPMAGSSFQGGTGGTFGDGGGGGGGGYFGGGGGGGGWISGGAGGGGGSNFAPPWADITHGVDAGNGGDGKIVLSYAPGDTSCLAAPLTITKSVSGAPEPGTIVTVTVSCDDATIDPETVGGTWLDDPSSSATLDFAIDANGVAHAVGTETVGFSGPNRCTVTETASGGATSVSYECTSSVEQGQPGLDGRASGFTGARAVDPAGLCSSGGPQSTPITVDIVEPDQTATVSIANTFPAALVEIQPRFPG
jgi:hypothetical protein